MVKEKMNIFIKILIYFILLFYIFIQLRILLIFLGIIYILKLLINILILLYNLLLLRITLIFLCIIYLLKILNDILNLFYNLVKLRIMLIIISIILIGQFFFKILLNICKYIKNRYNYYKNRKITFAEKQIILYFICITLIILPFIIHVESNWPPPDWPPYTPRRHW